MFDMKKNKLNVVIVSVDCLRFDHVGYFGSSDNLTPNLDKFLARCVVFLNAFANSAATRGSFPSILFSRYSWEVYNSLKGSVRKNVLGIQGFLKKYG